MSSATIKIQAQRAALRTIFQVVTKLRTDFKRKKFTVEVVYPEKLVMLRLNVRGSTVFLSTPEDEVMTWKLVV